MSCEEIRERLDAYVDGELDERLHDETRRHLGRCLACRCELDSLRALLAAAAELPPGIEPPRDLWPGIEARLGRGAERRRGAVRWARLAAAAALVLALAAPLLVRWLEAPAAPEPEALPGGAVAARADLARTEDGVLHAHSDLWAAIESQRGVLSAETLRVMEENVRILDEAVAQIRAALDDDPGNRQLSLLLAARYQQEVKMLKRVRRI